MSEKQLPFSLPEFEPSPPQPDVLTGEEGETFKVRALKKDADFNKQGFPITSVNSSLSEDPDQRNQAEMKESLSTNQTHILPVRPQALAPSMKSEHAPLRKIHILPISSRFLTGTRPASRNNIPVSVVVYPLILPQRQWKFSHALIAFILLLPFIGTGILEYIHLNQARNSLYQVDILSGATEWQHTITSPVQTLTVDAQGSLLNITASQNMHRVVAVDHNGIPQWKTFASLGTFSLPAAPSRPGTVLVALSWHASVKSVPAMSDTSVSLHPLNFYLFNRNTGQTLWQDRIVGLNQRQNAAILGADAIYIYVALTPTNSTPARGNPLVQLLAIDLATGKIAWHISRSARSNILPQDAGKLLVQRSYIFWQVAGTVYAIDPVHGKIVWQRFLKEYVSGVLLQEEAQMVGLASILLVGRSDAYHALAVANGKESWVLPDPIVNFGSAQLPGNIAAAGNTLLIYGSGQIVAINAVNRQIMWSQKQLDAISNLSISDDGTLAYVRIVDSVEESAPSQALAALDMKNGAVRWTFQPLVQETFLPLALSGILYRHNILLTATCNSNSRQTCTLTSLYAINGATGKIVWKYEANSISDVHFSSDSRTILFQSNSSAWLDLSGHFRS